MALSPFVLLVLLLVAQGQGRNVPDGNDSVLKSVIVVFRHGDRNIIGSYPTDPYADISYWPGGYGQLTNIGKERHLKLGQWFRYRYQDFLPSNYSLYDIVIRASGYDRTLMSAEAHLAGLYPPTRTQVFEPDLPWQPIPIHTRPQTEDPVLAQEKPCPKHDQLLDELLNTPEFLEYKKQAQSLYSYLSNHTGTEINMISQLGIAYDTLFIEHDVGYRLPAWTQLVFPEPMKRWASLSFAIPSYTPALARLMTGPFLTEVVNNYLNVTEHEDASYQKYRIYSAHDATIANILTTLGAFNHLPPPYASALIFELRQNEDGYFVNLLYKNSTVPVKVTIKGCSFDCDLNTFVNLLKPFVISPEEWDKECNEKVNFKPRCRRRGLFGWLGNMSARNKAFARRKTNNNDCVD